jgi:nucleotide-binding universal stress UspA family protein
VRTIVVGVRSSPGTAAAVRIAAAFAHGLGGRLVAVQRPDRSPSPQAKTQEPQSDKEESMSVAAVQTRHIDPSVAGDVANGPIVAAVDGSPASRVAIDTAIRLGRELGSPLTFVYVRRGPASIWGSPIYQRRLTGELVRARRALNRALNSAERAGITAEAEILEGKPRRRILEFARDRGASYVVVGSRGRRLRRSVSSGVARTSERPVVVSRRPGRLAVAGRARLT